MFLWIGPQAFRVWQQYSSDDNWKKKTWPFGLNFKTLVLNQHREQCTNKAEDVLDARAA